MGRATFEGAALASAISAGLLAAAPAAAQDSQRLAEFYRGRTINLMIGTVAGGEYDLHARLIGRFIGKHLPGNPTVVPQNMPGGGGVVMANYLYNVAAKDGTSIAVLNKALPASQAMGEPTLKMDNSKLFWLGTLAQTSEVVAVWRTAGITTLEEAKKEEVVIGTTGTDNITYTFPKLLNELVGTKFKLITGYRGGVDINVAMERGEVGGRQNTWTSWKTTKPHWLKNRDLIIIVQGGPSASDLPGIPNVEDLVSSDVDKQIVRMVMSGSILGRPIVTTPGVPAERVKALRDAFDATMKDPEFLAACKEAKVEVEPVPGTRLQEVVAQVLATPPAVTKRAKELMK